MRLLRRRWLIPLCLMAECLPPANSFEPALQQHATRRYTRRPAHPSVQLAAVSSSDDQLSAAARARRDEEQRRLGRREEVVVGQTSAKAGAKDLEINPRITQEAWLSQASEVERQVYQYTDRGMTALKMMQIEQASEAFDCVFRLRPETYLWQAGVAKFYLEDLEGAADIFARNAQKYEALFGEPASEERIWRNACLLKMYYMISRADRKILDQDGGGISSLLEPMPDEDASLEMLTTERRKVMRIARDLFSASVNKDFVGIILSRAKLRAIAGRTTQPARLDRKMWRLSAWYYLGLHYDALGETRESKKCLKAALKLCPSIGGNADDIVHSLPLIHMTRREWFDGDEMDNDEPAAQVSPSSPLRASINSVSGKIVDPIIAESIGDSLLKLRHADLKAVLKERGLLCNGMKDDLQKRMFQVLIEDFTRTV